MSKIGFYGNEHPEPTEVRSEIFRQETGMFIVIPDGSISPVDIRRRNLPGHFI
jgi:hypothetical protein